MMSEAVSRPIGIFALGAFPAAGALYVTHVISVPVYVALSIFAVSALVLSIVPVRSPRAGFEARGDAPDRELRRTH